jgi:hypothetical protein
MRLGSAATRGSELPLELFQPPEQSVPLARERGDLPVPPLVLLGEPRLELGLALVEVLQLGLETRDALFGRQIADEEHVQREQQENDTRHHQEPGDPRIRPVRHGLGF